MMLIIYPSYNRIHITNFWNNYKELLPVLVPDIQVKAVFSVFNMLYFFCEQVHVLYKPYFPLNQEIAGIFHNAVFRTSVYKINDYRAVGRYYTGMPAMAKTNRETHANPTR